MAETRKKSVLNDLKNSGSTASYATEPKETVSKSEIPPTGVGGWFRSSLQRDRLPNLGIPPTEVGGLFRSNLLRRRHVETQVSFVRARPRLVSEAGSEQSTNFRWWDSRTRFTVGSRLDLNHPPTPVGGIWEFHSV